jgi:hypothetical protein
MSLFARLTEAAAHQRLPFLVIGAHAVIEHGFQRGTEDADVLGRKEDRACWQTLLIGLGYRVVRDGGSFIQFEAADPSEWNVDLMLVSADAFAKLQATATTAQMDGAEVAVPSLEHLLALTIHALKHGRGLRVL